MNKNEALALAEKRNRHKGRALLDKEWRADHSAEKGWHVVLVDSAAAMWRDAEAKRQAALTLLARDDARFFAAAGDALLAQVRARFAETPAQGIEARRGETRQGLDAKHESPVAESDAPKSSQGDNHA